MAVIEFLTLIIGGSITGIVGGSHGWSWTKTMLLGMLWGLCITLLFRIMEG